MAVAARSALGGRERRESRCWACASASSAWWSSTAEHCWAGRMPTARSAKRRPLIRWSSSCQRLTRKVQTAVPFFLSQYPLYTGRSGWRVLHRSLLSATTTVIAYHRGLAGGRPGFYRSIGGLVDFGRLVGALLDRLVHPVGTRR